MAPIDGIEASNIIDNAIISHASSHYSLKSSTLKKITRHIRAHRIPFIRNIKSVISKVAIRFAGSVTGFSIDAVTKMFRNSKSMTNPE